MSTIANTDWVLVNRGSTSYKCAAGDLKDKLTSSDYILVNNGSSSYKVQGPDIKDQIGDSHWVLINRGSTSYKCSGADFKDILGISYPAKSSLYKGGVYSGFAFDKSVSTVDRTQESLVMIQMERSSSSSSNYWRLLGPRSINTAVVSPKTYVSETMDTLDVGSGTLLSAKKNSPINNNGNNHIFASFLNHPGYLDTVMWSGNNTNAYTARTISHDLQERPGLVWVFVRYGSGHGTSVNPTFWHEGIGDTSYIYNVTDSSITLTGYNRSNVEYMAVIWGGGSQSQGGNGDGNIKCGSFTDSTQTVTTGFDTNFVWYYLQDEYYPKIVIDDYSTYSVSEWSGTRQTGGSRVSMNPTGFQYTQHSGSNTVYYLAI